MRPGQMSEKILFRYSTAEFDPGTGDVVTTWHTRAECWALIEFKRGEERALVASISAPFRDYNITVRNRFDIEESDTIVWNGKTLAIRSIGRESSRDLYLTLEAEMGGGDPDAVPA